AIASRPGSRLASSITITTFVIAGILRERRKGSARVMHLRPTNTHDASMLSVVGAPKQAPPVTTNVHEDLALCVVQRVSAQHVLEVRQPLQRRHVRRSGV